MRNQNWTKEETILAFELYCQIPFGQNHHTNPLLIELGDLIGRSSSAVSRKLSNLASLDPEKSIMGLQHGSKMDQAVFNEFYKDYEKLVNTAYEIKKQLGTKDEIDDETVVDTLLLPQGENVSRNVKTRRGQVFFRKAILNAYHGRCCVTGINRPELLIASYIIPWSNSEYCSERTNPANGLCLNALHDRAFDEGLMTIDENYRIVLSSQLKNTEMKGDTKDWFMSFNGKVIDLPDKFLPNKDFLRYHNDVIFKL